VGLGRGAIALRCAGRCSRIRRGSPRGGGGVGGLCEVFSSCCAVGYGCVVSYGLKGHRWHRSLRRCSPVKQSPSAHCPHNDISANLSCVKLTATQLLNSGWRSPNEACTAGARARTRHRKENSRTGGAKSRRSILHVQRCCLYYLSVLREAKTQRLLHTCRGQAKQEMTGV
jgi:hypothetical protein